MEANEKARQQLRHALKNQKTIQTSKLRKLLNDMNISLKKNNESLQREIGMKMERHRQVAKKENRRKKAEERAAKKQQSK